MHKLLYVLIVLIAGYAGYYLHDQLDRPDIEGLALRVEDQVNRISQFATAEGLYSRVYRYKDEGTTSWLPFTDKEILVRADARVLVGFKVDSVDISIDYDHQELLVRGWPPPQELAFEYDTEYFDVREGLFTEIDAKILNKVKAAMRERIAREVDYPALYAESYDQADELLELIRIELSRTGWSLRVEDWPSHNVLD